MEISVIQLAISIKIDLTLLQENVGADTLNIKQNLRLLSIFDD